METFRHGDVVVGSQGARTEAGEAGPQELQALKRKLGPQMQEVLPGAKMDAATNAAPVYVPGLVPEQFTGRTTAGILDEFASALAADQVTVEPVSYTCCE